MVSLADRVQAQTGLPVLLLDGTLRRIPETYGLLGDILDRREAAAARAGAAERILAEAEEAAARLTRRGAPAACSMSTGRRHRDRPRRVAQHRDHRIRRRRECRGGRPRGRVAAAALPGAGAGLGPRLVIGAHPDFPAFARQDPYGVR